MIWLSLQAGKGRLVPGMVIWLGPSGQRAQGQPSSSSVLQAKQGNRDPLCVKGCAEDLEGQ